MQIAKSIGFDYRGSHSYSPEKIGRVSVIRPSTCEQECDPRKARVNKSVISRITYVQATHFLAFEEL